MKSVVQYVQHQRQDRSNEVNTGHILARSNSVGLQAFYTDSSQDTFGVFNEIIHVHALKTDENINESLTDTIQEPSHDIEDFRRLI